MSPSHSSRVGTSIVGYLVVLLGNTFMAGDRISMGMTAMT
jgi:hypothetical protein